MTNLIFLRQLKELVQPNEPSYTGNDVALKLAIASASETVQTIVGRTLDKQVYTEVLNFPRNFNLGYDIYGSGWSGYSFATKSIPIALKQFPIDLAQPFSVYFDPCGIFDSSTLLDPSEYTVDDTMGILYVYRAFNAATKALKVVYTAGYQSSVDTVGGIVYDASANPAQEQALANVLPANLVQATLFQAWHVFNKMTTSNLNVKYDRGEGSTNSAPFVNLYGIAPECSVLCAMNRRPKIAVI